MKNVPTIVLVLRFSLADQRCFNFHRWHQLIIIEMIKWRMIRFALSHQSGEMGSCQMMTLDGHIIFRHKHYLQTLSTLSSGINPISAMSQVWAKVLSLPSCSHDHWTSCHNMPLGRLWQDLWEAKRGWGAGLPVNRWEVIICVKPSHSQAPPLVNISTAAESSKR